MLYDLKRLDLFQKLYESLVNTRIPPKWMTSFSWTSLPFFEAYFSNFIEGVEFQVEEASDIIFKGKIPKNRPEDAHDILGTYQITSDVKEMSKCPKKAHSMLIKTHAFEDSTTAEITGNRLTLPS